MIVSSRHMLLSRTSSRDYIGFYTLLFDRTSKKMYIPSLCSLFFNFITQDTRSSLVLSTIQPVLHSTSNIFKVVLAICFCSFSVMHNIFFFIVVKEQVFIFFIYKFKILYNYFKLHVCFYRCY